VIQNATGANASFVAPQARTGGTIHIVLTATDTGAPPLTRYQRVVMTVNGAAP
jgi:hypothetical protein